MQVNLDGPVYAQSKLALTMWSIHLAHQLGDQGPLIIPVNPASFLGSKLVKDAYGLEGNDLGIGADILCRAALSEEFSNASGKYFDNDSGLFKDPHADALDAEKNHKAGDNSRPVACRTALAEIPLSLARYNTRSAPYLGALQNPKLT